MPQKSTFTLFTLRGIRIGVDWSWFVVLALIIWLLTNRFQVMLGAETGETGPYALAVISALLFFASILLHELGHAMVALRNKIGISHITLFMFGGVAGLERDSHSPGVEFRIAVAGPLVTLLIAAACIGTGTAIDPEGFRAALVFDPDVSISPAIAVLALLGWVNSLLFVFNLLPAFPMDGGRIVRAIAWALTGDRNRATGFAARLGQGFAFGFVALGIMLLLGGYTLAGVWLAVIGFLVGQAAQATAVRSSLQRQLGDLRVADVMDDEPVAIPLDATVERALDEYFLRYQWPWFPVVDAGRRFIGLVKRGAADAVPEISRASRTVAELLDEPGEGMPRVRDDAPLDDLLGNTELRRLGALVAVDAEGRISGVITLDQLGRALRQVVAPPE